MEPASILFSAILVQLSSTGLYFMYDYGLSRGYFGGRNDIQRYNDGELWWWEVKEADIVTLKRIEECNKVVANPDNAAVKSMLCIIQSWKLKMKMDAIQVVKDGAKFVAQHKDFFLVCFSFLMTVSVLKRAFERKKKVDSAMDHLDACSHKSPHFVKKPEYETVSDKQRDLAKEMVDTWKSRAHKENKSNQRPSYRPLKPTYEGPNGQ